MCSIGSHFTGLVLMSIVKNILFKNNLKHEKIKNKINPDLLWLFIKTSRFSLLFTTFQAIYLKLNTVKFNVFDIYK